MTVMDYKHILLAYDGSTDSDKALVKSINLAKANEAKLTVAYVVDMRSLQLIKKEKSIKLADLADHHTSEMKDKIEKTLTEKTFTNYQIRFDKGNPKTVITYDLIDDVGADMVVCGSNGVDSIDRLLIGSTSENIVRYSTVDVLVVK